MRSTIRQLAPAKVNLALSVGAADPSAEGKHPICSWMVSVNLHDVLELTRAQPGRMSLYAIQWDDDAPRKTEIDWPITRDLAVRAHLALENQLGRRLPLRMKLTKSIPVGGGLGGGSSDAAAMLRGCNDLFELDLGDDELLDLAMTLGSDVGFALRAGSAIVEGFGERIEPRPHVQCHLTLVFPDCQCPTGLVYRAFDDLNMDGALEEARVRALTTTPLAEASPFNDLAEPARSITTDLANVMADVSALADAPCHLTGSGSTVFVVCTDPLHAEMLAQVIRDRLSLAAMPVRTITHPDEEHA
ncbi:MAG: hypothetical protein KAS72_13420 [Phycisphaerales bacterium]|nr:hypothetical protein [Phycisphaerales bacterium]